LKRLFLSWNGLGAVLVCVVLTAAAQLCLKAGMMEFDEVAEPGRLLALAALLNKSLLLQSVLWILAGLVLYVASMLVWIRSLRRVELSVAYSMLSLNYVLVYVVATQWARIGEAATVLRSTGIAVIVLGVLIVMSTTDTRTQEN
jgi:undecaprenyl phosphate-alpha-L-ara4N flippase subunit ArnF